MLTARIPAEKTWTGQFRIGRVGPGGSHFQPFEVGNWRVDANCRCQDVLDGSGRKIGLLLGTPIDYQAGELVERGLRLDLPTDTASRDAAIEQGLYKLGGGWLCVLAADGLERIYLDADGTLSLVYDPAQEAAASSAGLLLDDGAYAARFDATLYQALDLPGDGWFPSGLTAHTGIHRLLCNHYLDLSTFETRRHWPLEPFSQAGNVDASALRVAEIVRQSAQALLKRGRLAVALTGGNETRFLLAAYKPIIDQLTFVTVSAPSTQRDVELAMRLAARFKLRHLILPLHEATEQDQLAWHYATGHCVSGPNMVSHPTIRPLAGKFDWFLGGLGGEIGRAFFWRPTDTPDSPMRAQDLVPRFGMPMNGAVVDATERWLEGVSTFDALTKLDLGYLELRMSAWSAAQTYPQSFIDHEHPLIAREVYALMLDLPPHAKRGNLLIKSAIEQLWPDLSEIPINRYGDYRDTLEVMLKVADHKRVAKKLRKIWG